MTADPIRASGARTGPLALAATMVIAASAIIWKVTVAIRVGPRWDTYAFLANAAEYAGKGFGYAEPHRAPLLPWLTSLVFRANGLSVTAIQWIDGILTLTAVPAMYLLLRRRASPVMSAAAALSLLCVTPLWEYVGIGYTDTAAIALSLWLVLSVIAGTEVDPRWLLVSGPLFTAAVMMRYTALLVAFPLLVWLALRSSLFRHARPISFAVLLGVATYLPAARYYHREFGDALFPFVVAFGFSEAVSAPGSGTAAGSGWYYLTRSPVLFGPSSLALVTVFVVAMAGVALAVSVGRHLDSRRLRTRGVLFAVAATALAVVAQLQSGLALRQMTLALAVFALWRAAGPRDDRGLIAAGPALDATMAAWLVAYIDLHGHQQVIDPRYFIPMAVPLIHFTVRGLSEAGRSIGDLLDSTSRRTPPAGVVPRAATLLFVLYVACSLAWTIRATGLKPDPYLADAREASRWLAGRPDIQTATTFSDYWPITAWTTRSGVHPMPSFEDSRAFAHELAKSDADYYLTLSDRDFDHFTTAARKGSVSVLSRSEEETRATPRVLYLGKSWDNYLEQLTGFSFFLDSTAGRYGWEGTAFLDGPSPAYLARYDVVAVYGAKWRDRRAGERALRDYVEKGGTVIIDASKNLDGLTFPLVDTVVLDSVVRRRVMPETASIDVDDEFAAAHGLGGIDASSFVDENGGRWSGASYQAPPGKAEAKVLASAGGRPIVSVRTIGQGRVFYVGFNLAWHAFSKHNSDEAALVSAVFDEALATGSSDEESR